MSVKTVINGGGRGLTGRFERRDERAFLPAALEVVETPASCTHLPSPSPSAVPVAMLHVALCGRAFATEPGTSQKSVAKTTFTDR